MRKTFLLAAATFVAGALGCGDGGPGLGPGLLAVDSTRPPAGATDVEAGTTVRAYFSKALNPSTVTGATFTLSTGSADLASQVTYDAASQAAVLSGPLLPGRTYHAAVAAVHAWSFTTRTWQPVVVDQTGNVGVITSLAVDGNGAVHVSYYDDTNGDLKYATCAASCTTATNWQTAVVDQGGIVGWFTSLAMDGSGRVHVSYLDLTNNALKYATCAASCTTATSWQTVVVDQSGGLGTSLAVDGSGRVHVSYEGGGLKYATCVASCVIAANWQTLAIDQTGNVGDFTSLAVDGNGRVHVSYRNNDNGNLKYAFCGASCTTVTSWQTVAVDEPAFVSAGTSLAVGGSGRVHVSYWDARNNDVKYATCVTGCATAGNWQAVAVDQTWAVGTFTSLAVNESGRVHVSYSGTNGDLKYATCAASCTTAPSWQTVAVDQAGDHSSLAVDGNGGVHVSYWDRNGHLKYIR